MAKKDVPGFVTVNVRFPDALMAQVDAQIEVEKRRTGYNVTRSDVIRSAVEERMRAETPVMPQAERQPAKKVAGRR